mgnify:CR=1 FL=1
MNVALAPNQWLRRSLWIAGLLVVTAAIGTVATFNANTVKPNLNFTMPDSVLLQVRDSDKAGWLTIVIADNGRQWFIVPAQAVVSNGVTVQTVEGARVEVGQPVATIEAMKMEASITSNVTGIVRRLAVPMTQAVDAGDLILVVEPE